MGKIRVLIADDHAVVRDGLCQIINSQEDMEIVDTAKDGRQALKKAKTLKPDVALLDIAMPHINGLDAIHLIKEAVPRCEVVILSMHEKETYVYQALSFGALGYVLKASSSSEVLGAIRSARRGEYFLSSKISAEVINGYLKSCKEKPIVRGYDLLTEKEQQVFRLVVEGNTTKQIAEILCVSPKTIEKHRTGISSKLGINSIVDMVKYAIKIGIIHPDL